MSFVTSILASMGIVALFQVILIKCFKISEQRVASFEQEYGLLYFICFLILTTAIFYVLSNSIIKRLSILHKHVSNIKDGKAEPPLTVTVIDEIGDLTIQVDEMVQALAIAKEKALQSEVEKNQIIEDISHDLRTPLTALLGYTELLKSNIGKDSNACMEHANVMERKCLELRQQINELLDYTKLTSVETKLNKEWINVKEVIQQVLIDFMPSLEKKGMGFSIKSQQEKIKLSADLSFFIRLMQNLISNGIQYGRANSNIRIEVLCEDSLEIRVTNEGDKIPDEDIPYVFERFYRADKSRGNSSGKGLGLAIVKHIAKLHDAEVGVMSNTEETVFIVKFPRYQIV